MNKQETLAFIERQIAEGVVTREEVVNGMPGSVSVDVTENKSHNLINTFYGIGGVIVVIGVIILIVQNWTDIDFVGQMLVTLGIAFITYASALIFKKPEHDKLSQVFFTISAALAPIGAVVFCNEMDIDMSWGTQTIVALIFFVIYLAAYFAAEKGHRKSILVFLCTAFATWTYYAVILNMLEGNIQNDWVFVANLMKWATIILGVCYIFLGSRFVPLRDFFYNVGALGILGAGISIGGFFDVIYIAFIFAAFYGSVYLKSRGMLTLGAMFLIAHIIKITSEHFAGSIGWPLALVFIGFIVIGIGYGTLWINRTYIAKSA